MKQSRDKITTGPDAMPQEIAGAVNLMAHPMAGAAAASAIGLGFASQAFGMWLGAMAGAAEASRAMLGALPQTGDVQPALERKAASLKLVVSKPAQAEPKVAAAVQPVAIARPAAPDDLKAIAGVGPKLEKVLNGLGIWTYSQVAALGDAQIAWLDTELGFSGRIARDDWVGQASALSDGA